MAVTAAEARTATLALLDARDTGRTVCPSEVARAIAGDAGWRDAMTPVHDAIDGLVDEGRVRLSWKGEPMARRAGPYRIARG